MTSNRSTSSTFQPAFFSSLLDRADRGGGEQARLLGVGGVADDAGDGFMPQLLGATLSRVITRAAAPSLIELALAAVIVPSLRKAGFRVGILAGRPCSGCSSVSTTGLALAARDRDRHDLGVEGAAGDRGLGARQRRRWR